MGKSSLIARYCDRVFDQQYRPTTIVTSQYFSAKIDLKIYVLRLHIGIRKEEYPAKFMQKY